MKAVVGVNAAMALRRSAAEVFHPRRVGAGGKRSPERYSSRIAIAQARCEGEEITRHSAKEEQAWLAREDDDRKEECSKLLGRSCSRSCRIVFW